MLPSDFAERFRAELVAAYSEHASMLHEAIAYSLCGPGKLLRPKLVYASALASDFENDPDLVWEKTLKSMMAVEMIHCYSLVHDDLPAMDDDDYRRGRLSCHKKFGEAVAILVGDALVADAFEILSASSMNALLQVRELAKAIGSRGMALGQHFDLDDAAGKADFEVWRRIHQLKTGCLFESACVLGGLSVGANANTLETLREFARAYGLAFQLRDDLKDEDASVRFLGRERVQALLKEHAERAAQLSHDLKSEALLMLSGDLIS